MLKENSLSSANSHCTQALKRKPPKLLQSIATRTQNPCNTLHGAALDADSGLVVKLYDLGADMKVELVNDGPITIWMDSKTENEMALEPIKVPSELPLG